jgi:hypothetical protein
MKALLINNTATDLLGQDTPFLPGMDVVVTGANGLVIQGADTAALLSSAPVTLGTIPAANAFLNINLTYRFVRVSTSANAWLLNN